MKRYSQLAVACLCILVVGGVPIFVVSLTSASKKPNDSTAVALNPSDPLYNTVICGPSSLSIALGRLGFSVSQSEIASKCSITPRGVALTDLELYASKHKGTRAAAKRLLWDELRATDGVAVLFVKGDHYVVADPRERSSESGERDSIRVYDRDVPATWYARAELEQIWSGEALVISRLSTAPEVESDACIAWDECYIDKGIITDSSVLTYKFVFRNVGKKELLIKDMRSSCGCVKHRISSKILSPGESAWIEVDVNIDGRQGYVHQNMTLSTNDSRNPNSCLQMACGIPKKWPLSRQSIRLPDLPQGGSVSQEFVVADPGFRGVKIRSAQFLSRGEPKTNEHPFCLISWKIIGNDSTMVSEHTGFSASPGDYLVRISFNAANVCPVGPFEGDVVVTIETDRTVTSHKIDVQGSVVHDVYPVPRMALISLDPDSEDLGTTTIGLLSRENRKVKVEKAFIDNSMGLGIELQKGLNLGENSYVISARIPKLVTGAAPFRTNAMFKLDSGIMITVPVTVYRPPAEASPRPLNEPVNK